MHEQLYGNCRLPWVRGTCCVCKVKSPSCVCKQGLRGKELMAEADTLIADLQLEDKRNVPSANLSGGMKRKLRWVFEVITSL